MTAIVRERSRLPSEYAKHQQNLHHRAHFLLNLQ